MAAPQEQDRVAGRHERDEVVARAVAIGRRLAHRRRDRLGDRAAVHGQQPRRVVCPCDGLAVDGAGIRAELSGTGRTQRRTEGRDASAAGVALSRVLGDVPRREEVVGLMAAGGEVVVDVDRVGARLQALDRQAEGNDLTLVPGRVVLVEVAVLPLVVRVGVLIEVDAERCQHVLRCRKRGVLHQQRTQEKRGPEERQAPPRPRTHHRKQSPRRHRRVLRNPRSSDKVASSFWSIRA